MEMNFSNGWLYKLKKRNSFARHSAFCESPDMNIEGIISELPKLRKEYQSNQSTMFLMPTNLEYSTS